MLFQYLGELCANLGLISLPGPLLGMLMLLIVLTLYGRPIESLDYASNLLIQNLSLLFIPPSVGAFFLGSQIYQQFPLLLATILVSTGIAMIFMAVLIRKLTCAPSDSLQ